DAEEAAEMFPPLDPASAAAAARADHASDIDTDALIQRFARTARGHGAQILTRSPVTAISRDDDGWHVTVPQGEITARTIVNAAGPWADVIARLAGVAPLGLQPHRRSMARIPAPGGLDPARWPMTFGVAESWYAKPDAGALIVSPAEADPMDAHDAWADDMVLAEGLARYEALMRFPVDRLISSWAGLRTFAPDGSPVYGRDPERPDFIWFAGQGGYGFQSAPAAARLIADIALDRPTDPDLTRIISPARFRR
ncbi:MAG TPA: FAD-binding oxidoreductase, partial [Paracoccus sp. (in: a-proteobacteria)]|nr:FAD-binding oxidoreductase [Paracoccus sp. (in: a-proteobacteria)]